MNRRGFMKAAGGAVAAAAAATALPVASALASPLKGTSSIVRLKNIEIKGFSAIYVRCEQSLKQAVRFVNDEGQHWEQVPEIVIENDIEITEPISVQGYRGARLSIRSATPPPAASMASIKPNGDFPMFDLTGPPRGPTLEETWDALGGNRRYEPDAKIAFDDFIQRPKTDG